MDLYEFMAEKAVCDNAFISVTGGGGKTTFLIRFASWLKAHGKKVLVTTTTKVRSPYVTDYGADCIFGDESVLEFEPSSPCIIFYAVGAKDDAKWTSVDFGVLEILKGRYDVVLNESDGSRGLPVKIHTSRDPQVPPCTTYTVSVMGLWASGKMTSEVAFGEERNLVVDRDYLAWYLDTGEGLLKGSHEGSRAIIFNGADSCSDEIIRGLDYPADVTVVSASIDKGVLYGKIS